MTYPISTLDGIDPITAGKLKSVGIRTTGALLEAAKTMKGRKALAETTGIDESRILKWANMADLFRIKGVGEEYSELLEAAGVDLGGQGGGLDQRLLRRRRRGGQQQGGGCSNQLLLENGDDLALETGASDCLTLE